MRAKKKKSGTLSDRLAIIRLVAMDVDGVLTEGRVTYDNNGREYKSFDAHDGYGMTRAQRHGLVLALITGRASSMVSRRAKELGIKEVHQKITDKLIVYKMLKRRYGLRDEEVCYIGDDEPDVPVIQQVGVSAAPADGMDEVRSIVDIVTTRNGGRGAVREILDCILRSKKLL
ncbi:MAG TPA: HAD-IIIA family hydrolase [Bacteroidota bacterium]|nr:HAD-IIIA family hydrolase [Bacteroidota bacterium]